jgi:hypothetical protein
MNPMATQPAVPVHLSAVKRSHSNLQAPAQAGAVVPFRHSARAAAALLGFRMMATAVAIGVWIGVSYNGTLYLLTHTIAGRSFLCCMAAFTLVRRDAEVSRHA